MTEPSSRRGAPRSRRRRPRPDSDASGTNAPSGPRTPLTTTSTAVAVEPPTGFADLGVPEEVDVAIAAAGFAAPFAIQTEAIPVALSGRDLCGGARTGSGKTLAFGIPMLVRTEAGSVPRRPRSLVLVPTRELAIQVAEVLEPIATGCGRRILAVYGGASRDDQIRHLAHGVDIVVATPLRLIDLIKAEELSLDDIAVVVLDEADRMADEGFTPQVEWILRHVTGPHQTMLFSATLDGQVAHIVKRYLNDPAEVAIDAPNQTVGTMHHLFLGVHHMDKARVAAALASGAARTVVFCDTKRLCDKVAASLKELGVQAEAIHGDLPQAARERALGRFARGELAVLVATDVAARGIDVDDIGIVIHYEPVLDHKNYLHRSGRTARAGRDGWAVTLAEYNQHTTCRILQRALRLDPHEPIQVFSNNPGLRDLSSFLTETA
jgi:superfamily II DNA/RNA helicase